MAIDLSYLATRDITGFESSSGTLRFHLGGGVSVVVGDPDCIRMHVPEKRIRKALRNTSLRVLADTKKQRNRIRRDRPQITFTLKAQDGFGECITCRMKTTYGSRVPVKYEVHRRNW